jgi:hypothetical protein
MQKIKSFTTKKPSAKPNVKRAAQWELTPQEKLVKVRVKLKNLRAAFERLAAEIPGSRALERLQTEIFMAEKYIVKLEIEAAEQV